MRPKRGNRYNVRFELKKILFFARQKTRRRRFSAQSARIFGSFPLSEFLSHPAGQHIQCIFTMFVTCIVDFVTGTPCKNTRCVLVTVYHRFDITFCIGLQILTFYFYIRSVIVGIIISGFIKNDSFSICCSNCMISGLASRISFFESSH